MKKVFLLSGKINSGKNQFAEYLKQVLEANDFSVGENLFAKELKDGCKDDFQKLAAVLESIAKRARVSVDSLFDINRIPKDNGARMAIEKILSELIIKDENWYEDKTEITRNILQLYGTEIFRRRVDNDWWAKKTLEKVVDDINNCVLITDCRFPNEITVFTEYMAKHEDFEVYIVRINREILASQQAAQHESETALDGWNEWNYIVKNKGTLDDLHEAAIAIVDDILNPKESKEILSSEIVNCPLGLIS